MDVVQRDLSVFAKNFHSSKLSFGESMRKHTTFCVGGLATLMVEAHSTHDVVLALGLAKEADIEAMVIGKGSNLIVLDKGLDKVVIRLGDSFGGLALEGNDIVAQAGVSLEKLSSFALESGLSGLEFACGIPGTLGGGIYMNAGAYGGQLADIVSSVSMVTPALTITEANSESMGFGYRKSRVQSGGEIVSSVRLSLKQASKSDILSLMQENTRLREEKQPLEYPSAGSIFKRPTGFFAGKLISDAGLKGVRIGGAQVSEKHAGFIVNTGGATAQNIVDLIKHVQERVYATSGVALETEVKIIGLA